MATTTRGFGFSIPQARGLAGLNPTVLQYANGASLVPDSGIENYYNGAAQGLQALTAGVLSGANSIAGGIKDRTALNLQEKKLAAEQEAQARRDAIEQQRYEQQMGLENAKMARLAASDGLSNELLRLQIQREKDPWGGIGGLVAGADPALPTPDVVPTSGAPALNQLPEELVSDPDQLPLGGLNSDQIFNNTPPVDQSAIPSSPFKFDLSGEVPQLPVAPLRGIQPDVVNSTPDVAATAPVAAPNAPSGPALRSVPITGLPGKMAVLDPISRKLVIVDAPVNTSEAAIPPGMRPKNVSVNSKGEKTTTYESDSEKGGEKLLQDQMKTITNITEAENTLNNIETKLNEIGEVSRGPLVGRARGVNPYDTEAQAVENMVNSLVPGLARGVFGEVGVLTDQDVARYKAMIPNIRTDPNLAKQIITDLKGKLASARESNLSTWELSGYDTRNLRKKYPAPGNTSAASATTGSLPVVTSDEQLKNIKSGEYYLGPNGKQYRKP